MYVSNGPATATRYDFADAASKYQATCEAMKSMICRFRVHPTIYREARRILRMCGVAGRDKVGEVNALHGFVRDQIVFRNDARGIEVVAYPTETMKMQSGDCDDKVVLLCALLESCGHTTRFITCSQNQNGQFTHVYPEVLLGGQWFALETVRRVPFGATPNGVTRREIHEY